MDDFTPRYVIIQNYIINKINQGDLAIGDKLPSENELSNIFNVSRVTSNKAISELNIMGLVERVRGKGTFVKSTSVRFQEMTHILSKSYKISSELSDAQTHKLVNVEFVNANESIVKKLNLKNDELICKITREMMISGEVIGVDYSYIPASMLNGKLPNEEHLSNYYVHEYMKMALNQHPKYLHIHIDTTFPNKFEMKVLNVPQNKPLILWDTNIIDENDKTIAYTATIAQAGKYQPFINFELK